MQLTAAYLNTLTASLNQLTLNQQTLTDELSTGLAVNQLSDNPSAVGQNVAIAAEIQQNDSYKSASSTASGQLQVTDSILGSVVAQLTKAISVATAGSGGTESLGDLQSVATTLIGIRDSILTLANSNYMGAYIFSGSKVNTAPFSLNSTPDPQVISYNGDTVVSTLKSPTGNSSIALNVPGSQIFTATSPNVFGDLNQLISYFQNGNPAAANSALNSLITTVSYVSQQRVLIDNSITEVTNQTSGIQTQSTQFIIQQTNLMDADTATVATQLSSNETQQTALEDSIVALEKQQTLFSVMQ